MDIDYITSSLNSVILERWHFEFDPKDGLLVEEAAARLKVV